MTSNVSTKVRTIGGASVLALSAGLAGPAFAQSAPAPLASAPTAPTAPTQPGNTQQCAETSPGVITCAPGTDPDGVGEDPTLDDPADPIRIIIEDGAFVTGSTGFASGASVTGDTGTIVLNSGSVVGGANGAVILNSDAAYNNLGYTSSDFAIAIRTVDNVAVRNLEDAVIYGTSSVALVSGRDGTRLINLGLIQNDVGSVLFTGGDGDFSTVTLVDNGVTGSIFGLGDNADVISITETAEIINAGLIQSFGVNSAAISVGRGTIVNDGNIATNGDTSVGIRAGEGTTITNNGLIRTLGNDFADALDIGNSVTVTNNGTISTAGDDSFGIFQSAGGSASITNSATGEILTAGVFSFGVQVSGNSTVVNDGLVETTGDFSGGIGVGDGSTVTNNGSVSTEGEEAFGLSVQGGSTVTNAGDIMTSGANSTGVNAFEDLVLNNSGSIMVAGAGSIAVDVDDNFMITNSGTIASAEGRGINVTGAGMIMNTATGVISSGTSNAVVLQAAGTNVVNFGTISSDSGNAVQGDAGADFIFNYGSITSTSGNAADLGDGNDFFYNLNGGSATGTVDGGAGGDSLFVLVTDDSSATFDVSTLGTQYINFERIGLGTQNFNPLDDSATAGTGTLELTGSTDISLLIINSATLSGTLTNFVRLVSRENPLDGTIANQTFTVAASGVVDVTNGQGVRVFDDGFTIANNGLIRSNGNNGITALGVSDLTIVNTGTIESAAFAAIEADDVTITNSGTIVSTSSQANELDGAIGFGAGAVGGTVTNEAGGVIEGDVGVYADASDTADQLVANFGTITGRIGEAAILGAGNDEFQHWTGAVTDGNVRLGQGDDTFVLEGSMSSILGTVSGGPGSDIAILGGVFDGDNIAQFENISFGQLFDVRVSGNRTVTGETTFDGNVTFALGVDTLSVDGNLTLEAGSVVTILTPLDEALFGQTVLVFEETGTFTDNGVTINIIDDDLLLDYTPILGSLSVQVGTVNPLASAGDQNVRSIANAVFTAINAGTLSNANLAALNALPDAAAYQAALIDALPSLSEGPAREIFESSSAASDALDRHLATKGTSVWGQVIVRGAEQDPLSPSAGGYDSDQLIFTVGADFAATDNVRIGALASFADIDNEDISTVKNSQVDSFKLGLYAAIDILDRGFLNTEIAYLTGDVETSRTGFFGTITSGFDFDGFSARSTLGYDLLPDENVHLTPTIGVNAAEINFDETTEAGGFGFTVDRGDAEFIELRGGIELGAQMSEGVDAFIKGTIIHDVIDSERSFRLESTQLPTFFSRFPLREQDRFELAAGADIDVSETFTIGLGYQGDFNSDYNAHSARATVRVGF